MSDDVDELCGEIDAALSHLAAALDSAGCDSYAADCRALAPVRGGGNAAWYRALCFARDRGHTADRVHNAAGDALRCVAWGVRGMLLRLADPDEARAHWLEWLVEGRRWATSPARMPPLWAIITAVEAAR